MRAFSNNTAPRPQTPLPYIEIQILIPPKAVLLSRRYAKNSTVRTIREDMSRYLKYPQELIELTLQYRLNRLKDQTPLMTIGFKPTDKIVVTKTKPELHFNEENRTAFQLPFSACSTVRDAKDLLSPIIQKPPESIELSFGPNVFDDSLPLSNVRVPSRCSIAVSERSGSSLEKTSQNGELTIKYLFMFQHEAYFINLDHEATVEMAIDELRKRAAYGTKWIQLKYDGLILKSTQKLRSLNIQKGDCIVADSEMVPAYAYLSPSKE